MRTIALADLPQLVGQELGVSDWLEITQERVGQFADATDDQQWIHVDVERATREIGGPIAHGFLTLSLIPMLARDIVKLDGVARALNYGLGKVRFPAPVRVGARIRVRVKLIGCETRGEGVQITRECIVEIEAETRPACIAETIAIVYPA